MRCCPTTCYRCEICGKQSDEHVGWFLVVENPWLDRVKIVVWHPVLAEQDAMHSVCGKQHLETLITYWLVYANLQFQMTQNPEFALADHENVPGSERDLPYPGQLVGELAVHRESLSRLWTGSAEARESIFDALISGLGMKRTPRVKRAAETVEPGRLDSLTVAADMGHFREFALP
jgi:hypothetical protein